MLFSNLVANQLDLCLYDHLGMETHVRDYNLDIGMLVVKSMLKNAYDDFMGFYVFNLAYKWHLKNDQVISKKTFKRLPHCML